MWTSDAAIDLSLVILVYNEGKQFVVFEAHKDSEVSDPVAPKAARAIQGFAH